MTAAMTGHDVYLIPVRATRQRWSREEVVKDIVGHII